MIQNNIYASLIKFIAYCLSTNNSRYDAVLLLKFERQPTEWFTMTSTQPTRKGMRTCSCKKVNSHQTENGFLSVHTMIFY